MLALLLVACGPSITVYPLVNEDPELRARYTHQPGLDARSPDAAALAAFLDACSKDDTPRVWQALSTRSQTLLDNLGRVLDSDGQGLLKEHRLPSLADGRTTLQVTPLTLFFFEGALFFERAPDGEPGRFLVINDANRYKPLHLVQEAGAWRVEIDDLKRILP
jgi:hypothetical protein